MHEHEHGDGQPFMQPATMQPFHLSTVGSVQPLHLSCNPAPPLLGCSFALALSVLFSSGTVLYPLPITSHHHRMRIDDCPMPHARHHSRGLSRRPTGCRRASPEPSAQCHGFTAVDCPCRQERLAVGIVLAYSVSQNGSKGTTKHPPTNHAFIPQICRRLPTAWHAIPPGNPRRSCRSANHHHMEL